MLILKIQRESAETAYLYISDVYEFRTDKRSYSGDHLDPETSVEDNMEIAEKAILDGCDRNYLTDAFMAELFLLVKESVSDSLNYLWLHYTVRNQDSTFTDISFVCNTVVYVMSEQGQTVDTIRP